jgi:hypothetical protein
MPFSTGLKARYYVTATAYSLIAVASLWGIVSCIQNIVAADRATAWPTADGVVVLSQTVRGCGKGNSYFPRVHYRYSTGGVDYLGKRLAFGNVGCGSETKARTIASRFPVDSAVTVHFNPERPDESVLMAGQVLDDTWLGLTLCTLMLVGALFFARLSLRSIRALEPGPTPRAKAYR